jgi:SAM-dependent methyltransferase
LSGHDYVLGNAETEQKRLILQASILRGWTEKFFHAAGLQPGMRVLDIGCGMGDVAFLAADIVGQTGSVVAIDRDLTTIEKARARAPQFPSHTRVTFEHADVGEYSSASKFDAVVGRYILLYQPDPVAALRRLAALVRSGGLMVFHEIDFGEPPRAFPEAPLWRKSWALMAEAFRRSGTPPDFGIRIARAFLDAGLTYPKFQAEVPMVAGPDSYIYGWVAETLRSLIPRIEQYGLSTAAELQIDTLASRLKAEAVALGSQLSGPVQVGAWVTLP